MTCATTVDWVAKLALLEEYRARDGLDWSAHRLQAIDLQYSDVRRDKGLAARLEARGRLARLFTDDEVDRAMHRPPHDTRAYFRGECLRRYPEQVAAASWDSVVFDIPGQESLLRVPTLEPLRGTREHVGALLDASPTPQELIAALSVST
jgi:proteasome accessory factor A